jgi:Peptidase family M48
VLAHELGHFTQRYAMRFGYLVRTVNLWFVRAVYDRDEWDHSLQAATNESAFGLVVGLFAQIAVAVTRGVLWVLMVVGHALSSFMTRQMERHADDWAMAIAGSDGFVSMHRRIELLGASFDEALKKVSNRHEFRLPDDLPKYTALLAGQLSGEAQTQLHEARSQTRLRWFYTHPTYSERARRAAEANLAGAVQDDNPALALFDDFDGMSKSFTNLFYEGGLRKPVTPDMLYPVIPPTTVVPDTGCEEARIKAYFCGLGFILKPVLLEQKHGLGLGMVTNVLSNLESSRNVLRGTDITAQREELKSVDSALLQALQAQALLHAGVRFEPTSFPALPPSTLSPDEIIQQLEARLSTLEQELEPLAEAGRTRLRAALSLVRSPHVGSRIENAQTLQDEASGLLHVLGKVCEVFPLLRALREQFAALQALLSFQSEPGPGTALDSVSDSVAKLLAAIQQALGPTSYPFSDVTGHVLLADYARSKDFNLNPNVRLLKDAQSYVEMLFSVYYRVLGRLVEIAEHVESQLDTP